MDRDYFGFKRVGFEIDREIMTKRESVRKGEISITEVDNQLKKLGGADKKIEYLENILFLKACIKVQSRLLTIRGKLLLGLRMLLSKYLHDLMFPRM